MSAALLDDQDTFELIDKRFVDAQDWIIITDLGMNRLTQIIENKFYPPKTPANRDFEVILRQPGGVVILLAKKARMTFNQLVKIVGPLCNKRTREQLKATKGKSDVIIIPSSQQTWETVTSFVLRLNGFIYFKERERRGMPMECQYHLSIPAELDGKGPNTDYRCKNEVCAGMGGLDPSGQPRAMMLCEEHFIRVSEFADKQPPLY